MEWMWKEAVMAYFKALSQHLAGMTGKYGTFLVTQSLQLVSLLFLSSSSSQSVYFIFSFIVHYMNNDLSIKLMYVADSNYFVASKNVALCSATSSSSSVSFLAKSNVNLTPM
jgi:hypothetical protein